MNNKIIIRSGWDRLRYALMFECLLVATIGISLSLLFGRSAADMSIMAAILSGIALLVNLIYNYIYDRIDVHFGRIPTERTLLRRAVHAIGFESILAIISLPILMWWLGLSLLQALLLDLGMMSAIVVYTFIFSLSYDKYFPVLQQDNSNQTKK